MTYVRLTVLLACCQIFRLTAFAQSDMDIKFERLSTSSGLSNDQVYSLYQDDLGYIWVGTLSGLNRYDGHQVRTFYHRSEDPETLADNMIIWVQEGPEGKMWVNTGEEVSIYDANSESFSSADNYLELLQTDATFLSEVLLDRNGHAWFRVDNRGVVKMTAMDKTTRFSSTGGDVEIASNAVSDIFLDNSGLLWIVHSIGIVEVVDPESNKVIRQYGLPSALANKEHAWSIYVDNDRDLWLYVPGEKLGLYYLNTRSGKSKFLDESDLSSVIIAGVLEEEPGVIWVGADHGGVSIIDKSTWQIMKVVNDPDVSKSLCSNNVKILFKDQSQGIWVGTAKSGLNYHRKGANTFHHYKVSRKEPAFNDMSNFAEDRNGDLWIGTNGKGLLKFNRDTRTFHSIIEDPKVKGFQPEVIVSLLTGSDGTLWVGSYLEGLFQFDGNRFKSISIDTENSAVSVWRIFEDSRKNIWIGTLNQGLYKIEAETGIIHSYAEEMNINSSYITALEEDGQGRVWIGSGAGLSIYDSVEDSFVLHSATNSASRNTISNNSIISIERDIHSKMWVGTLDGLNLYDENTDSFSVIREVDGLSSNIIQCILADDQGDLWMSTSRGVSKIEMADDGYVFRSFDVSDGLQGESFTEDAGLKTRDGYLIFSGQNGFNIFKPEQIVANDRAPKLMLSKLRIGGDHVVPGESYNGRVLLEKPLHDLSDIVLDYDENSFSIDFVAMSFFESGNTKYQYMLVGFDQQWINAPADLRTINYANLNYGSYQLRIRAANNSNDWSEDDISLTIKILPPFWQTIWAYIFYALAIVMVLIFVRHRIIQRERSKADRENERREVERQHQLDLMKIKFFTNISHEFRTPLSLVLTPIERMIEKPDGIKTGDLTIVHRNAKRLMTLVNQLLDFRKMEANQHVLSQSSGNIIAFLKGITESFSDLSREREISLTLNAEVKSFYTFFDKDKMEKIMFNLLSNAFKFTHPGGEIGVEFEISERKGNQVSAVIVVTDTGIGIPKEKHELIFNRFFQNEVTEDLINNGTGIGLSITKEFVELHGGKISVDSQLSMGSSFIVELPLKEIGSDDDIADELVKELTSEVNAMSESEVDDRDLPAILLVEDNFDFRFYLKDNLKEYYRVSVASNGKEGWRMIRHQQFDIIISDVMMPGMDGLELSEKIKSDPRTSHVPIILLTAQSSDRHRIEGLEAGAIEYISKPFNFEILLSSINSALKFQKRVKDAEQMIKPKTTEVEVESLDEKLIAKAVEVVEANMSNSEFSVEDLSHELGYSRGHFYQKVLKITGETPIDFIRNIRMKRAALLLEKSQFNISEIAYKVGYNNPKLFSRYFKSKFHLYPSAYRAILEESADSDKE